MSYSVRTGILWLVLALGMAGCGHDSSTPPAAPSPILPSPSGTPSAQPTIPDLLTGYVMDSAFRPLAGATLEVVEGPLGGASVDSDPTGAFRLPGPVIGPLTIRATKAGYVAATRVSQTITTSGRQWAFFYLEPLAPPLNLANDYSLTFIADSACATLPSELRTRTYTAKMTPASSSYSPPNTLFDVAVGGGSFLTGYDKFSAGVAGGDIGFGLDWDGPVLVEQLAPNTYLAFQGWAGASVGASVPSRIAASYDGVIDYCVTRTPMGTYYNCIPSQAVTHVQCASRNHQLILTRQ